ncbi:MAG: beta-carotene 15,15''-monooxygenase, Brp/Blh family [uncultured archaeon A07HB70]|nr:MAG: beta-carotene 15,15''-monooxygenase, Brp/Blh family [uncultured archaeon A07HB70]
MAVAVAPAARRTLTRTVVRPSWLALGAVALAAAAGSAVGADLPTVVVYAPFALSVVVLGLPHGAVDHLVPGRLGDGVTVRSVLWVALVYAALMAAYAAAWFVVPTASFVFFVALTLFHWGQGDVYALLALDDAEHLPTTAERGLALLVRGGLPMLAPLVAFPGRYREVALAAVSLFGADAAALAPLFSPTGRLAAAGGLFALSVLGLVAGGLRVRAGAPRTPLLVDAGEVALLWVYFAVVPPILAVGVYFCLWHALRHVARLLVVSDEASDALAAGDAAAALGRFARDAAPLTAVSLLLFAGLWVAVPNAPGAGDRAGLLGLYLVGIAVLTLPHVVVVTWMDHRQGVWRPRRRES